MVRVSDGKSNCAEQGKAKLCTYSILNHMVRVSEAQSDCWPCKAKPSYMYSILKPHGQSSKSPVRLLPTEAKLSYAYTILKNIISPELVPKVVVCDSTPRMYPLSGYFLVIVIDIQNF